MANINAGTIYYTITLDQNSLAAVREQVKSLSANLQRQLKSIDQLSGALDEFNKNAQLMADNLGQISTVAKSVSGQISGVGTASESTARKLAEFQQTQGETNKVMREAVKGMRDVQKGQAQVAKRQKELTATQKAQEKAQKRAAAEDKRRASGYTKLSEKAAQYRAEAKAEIATTQRLGYVQSNSLRTLREMEIEIPKVIAALKRKRADMKRVGDSTVRVNREIESMNIVLRKTEATLRSYGTATFTSDEYMKNLAHGVGILRGEFDAYAGMLSKVRRIEASSMPDNERIKESTRARRLARVELGRLIKVGNQLEDQLVIEMAKLEKGTPLWREYAKALKNIRAEKDRAEKQAADLGIGLNKESIAAIKAAKEIGDLSAQVEELNADQQSGRIKADEYSKKIMELGISSDSTSGRLKELKLQLMGLTESTKLSQTQIAAVNRELNRVRNAERNASRALNRINSRYANMQTATQLSYAASTLLNDKIFQLSPALGILTNQMIFTTEGFNKFAAAAAPIVVAAGAIIGLFAGLTASIKAGVGLESALEDVRKTTNLTNDELKSLTNNFQEMSKEVPVGVNELLEMAKVAGQLGITGIENIQEFTTAIAKLSIATDVVGQEGAESLARFLQALGTETDNMGAAANRVANILNELENTTASTAKEILNMTSYTQGLASQSNFTDAQILALNSTLLSLGVQAEAGGSALVRTLDGIQTAAANGGSELESMARVSGMAVQSFVNLADASPIDAFMALVEGMSQAAERGENLSVVLADLGINEVRERRALLALAQGFDVLSSTMFNATEQSLRLNSLNREVEIMTGKVESKVRMLGARFVEIAQNIGTALLPTVASFLDVAILLSDNLDILFASTVALSGAFASLALSVMAAQARYLVFLRVSSFVVNSFIAMKTALIALRTSLVASLGAMSIAFGAVGLAVSTAAGFLTYFALQGNKTKNTIDEVRESLDDLQSSSINHQSDIEALSEAYNSLDDGMGRQGILGTVSELAGQLEGPALAALSEFYSTTLTAKLAQDDFAGAIDATREAIEQMTRSQLRAREITLTTQIAEAREQLRALESEIQRVSSGGLAGLFGGGYNMQDLLDQYLALHGHVAMEDLPAQERQRLMGMSEEELMQFFGFEIDLEQLRQKDFASGLVQVIEKYQQDFQNAFPVIVGLESTIANLESQLLEVQEIQGDVAGVLASGDAAAEAPERTILDDMQDQFSYIDSAVGTFETEGDRLQAKIEVLTGFIEDIEKSIAAGTASAEQRSVLKFFIEYRNYFRDLAEGIEPVTGELENTASEFERAIATYNQRIAEVGLRTELMPGYTGNLEDTLRAQTSLRDTLISIVADPEIEDSVREEARKYLTDGLLTAIEDTQREIDSQVVSFDAFTLTPRETLRRGDAAGFGADEASRQRQLSSARTTFVEDLARIRRELELGNITQSEFEQSQISIYETLINSGFAYRMSAEELQNYMDRQKSLKEVIDDRNAQLIEANQLTAEEVRRRQDSASTASTEEDRQKSLSNARTRYIEGLALLDRRLEEGRITQSEYLDEQLALHGSLIESGILYRMSAEELQNYIDREKDLQEIIDNKNEQLERANQLTEQEIARREASARTAQAVVDREKELSAARTTHAEGLRVLSREFELGLISEEEFADGQINLYEALVKSGIAARMSEEELQEYLNTLRELKKEQEEANKKVVSFGEAMLDIASSLSGTAGDFGRVAKDIFDAFQTMTNGLDKLEGAAKKEQISTGIAAIVNSVSSLLPEYESTANQFVEATMTMAGAAIGFATGVPGGAQAGAAIGGFFSKLFGDLSNGLKQIQEQVKETVASTDYLSKGLVDTIAKESTIRVSRGGMYGGTKAALNQEAYDAAIQAASSVAAGLAGALKTGIDGAIRGDKDWKKNMRDALKESIVEQITNSFIEATLSGGEFDKFIKKFTELLKSEDVGAAMDYFNEKYKQVVGKLDKNTKEFVNGVGEAFRETLPEAIQRVYESAVDSVQFLSDDVVQNIIDNAVRRGRLNEELANQMISLADSIASGFASGLTKGINDAIMGERDWKKNLRESLRSTIMDSVINAFVQSAILDGVFGNFFETITRKIQRGNTEGAMKYASKNIAELSETAAQLIEEFVSSIDDELMPDREDRGGISRGSGAAISEITGPTRDLFLDLFRPLSILPSWTTMIRDIRNDVRSIAGTGGFINPPSVSLGQMSAASAPSVQNITINNPIINTQATDAKEVYRDISRYANKQRRGGK